MSIKKNRRSKRDSTTPATPPALKSQAGTAHKSYPEVLENVLFGIFVFASAAAFNMQMLEQFALPKLLVVRVGALVLCAVLIYRLYRGGLPGQVPRPIAAAVGALVFWWLVSTFCAVHRPTALDGYHGRYNGLYNQSIGLFLFLAFALSRLSLKRTELFAKIFVAAMVPLALYAMVQRLGLDPYPWPQMRPAATMGNPVLLAATLGLALPLAAFFAIGAGSLRERIAALSGVALLSGGILVTVSRGPWAAAVVSLFLVGCLAVRLGLLPLKKVALPLAAVLLVFVCWFALKGTPIRSDASIAKRVLYYGAAVAMVKDRPVTGAGFENFRVLYPRYRPVRDTDPSVVPTMVHNVFLERAVWHGIPGLILYAALLVVIIGSVAGGTAAREGEPRKRLFLYALAASVAGYLVQGMSGWEDVTLCAFFWTIAGLAVNAAREGREAGAREVGGGAGRFVFAGALALTFFLLSYLGYDAFTKCQADAALWHAEQLDPSADWNEVEAQANSALAASGNDSYYLDRAGMLFSGRFAASGDPAAYRKALGLFQAAHSADPFESYHVVHAIELDCYALMRGTIPEPSPLSTEGARSVAQSDRNNAQLYETIGRSYAKAKRYQEARKWLDLMRLTPSATRFACDLLEGEIARGMGAADTAIAALRHAIGLLEHDSRFDQQWANAKLVVASIEMEHRRADAALKDTQDVSRRMPGEIRSYIMRGDIYATKNDLARAHDSYREALAVDPKNEFARRGLEASERLLGRSR